MSDRVKIKPEALKERGIHKPLDFGPLQLRTLLLMMGDYTHAIDEMEEHGKPRFNHNIPRDVVEAEVRGMLDYIGEHSS